MRRVLMSRFESQGKPQSCPLGSTSSGPCIALSTMAQTSTVRQMGPILSIDQERAMAPVRGTRPKVGRRPVTPTREDGDEMEPSVSVPIAKAQHPAAVAADEPAEEPDEPCVAGRQGLRVRSPNHRSP